MPKILVVDDEPAIREMIGFVLKRGGFESENAADAEQARTRIFTAPPDLILMDWMLPGLSGFELTQQLKRNPVTQDIPVIVLTARSEDTDKVQGLDGGADDYVTKPFSPPELLARIKAVLRRAPPKVPSAIVEVKGLCLDPVSHRVRAGRSTLDLGPIEFRLLHFLMTHPERVYSRNQLIELAWTNQVHVEERTVDVHIRRLRKALEPSGHDRLIQTVRSAGYRLSAQDA